MELTARESSGPVVTMVTSTWHRGDTEEASVNVDFSVVYFTLLALHLVCALQVIKNGQKDRCHRLSVTFPVVQMAREPRAEDKRVPNSFFKIAPNWNGVLVSPKWHPQLLRFL